MVVLLGLDVPEQIFQQWAQNLVCEYAPYFLTADLARELQAELFLLERNEYKQFCMNPSHNDSYLHYRVSAAGEFICLLSAKELAKLAEKHHKAILKQQVDLRRGQVYQWNDVSDFLRDCSEASDWRVQENFILDASIWRFLSDSTRRAWLSQFIQGGQMTCISQTLSANSWENISGNNGDMLRDLLGWEFQSGANCFATTLAIVTGQVGIRCLWLHQETFLRSLEAHHYIRQEQINIQEAQLRNAVLVWEDVEGKAQHSAYLLAEQILINKDSQAWYTPRQLVYLHDLISHWQEDGLQIVVYTKS